MNLKGIWLAYVLLKLKPWKDISSFVLVLTTFKQEISSFVLPIPIYSETWSTIPKIVETRSF